MKTYEEMSEIVLARIDQERIPLWKSLLQVIVKYLIVGLIMVLIIVTLFFIIAQIHPAAIYYYCE